MHSLYRCAHEFFQLHLPWLAVYDSNIVVLLKIFEVFQRIMVLV